MSTFDLPINEVKGYIGDLMSQIGEDVLVDGIPSKIMLADLERIYTNLQQNMKKTVFLHDVNVQRGSRIEFEDHRIAIVYDTPNDDIVSLSAEILICNCNAEIKRYEEIYDTDQLSPTYGDIVDKGFNIKGFYYGFIERLSAKEKQFDVGLLHDAILRFITFKDTDVALGDIVLYKNKKYRVIDVDDITEGVLVVQLASVRD